MRDQEQRVEELFLRAVEATAEERETLFEAETNAEVVARVRKLIEHDERAPEDFLAGVPESRADETTELPSDRLLGEKLGGYRLLRRIGEGGMGAVYEAEQDNPRRRVALKLIRTGFSSPDVLKRFRKEAQVLGSLQHPCIAAVIEAGFSNEDQPFLAMEYIEGQSLTDYARDKDLTNRDRLELVRRVCDGVEHAHQRGVIHRDLKPANILVVPGTTRSATSRTPETSYSDHIGQPKILDFGVARLTDEDGESITLRTAAGQLIGTPAYMSPEQVEADSTTLDNRCDVYALGVILYELLSDQRPLDLTGKSIAEIARTIRDEDPVSLGVLDRELRGDITTIVAKAMEKDRDRRYRSAADLGDDLGRFMNEEPITARPDSAIYRMRKFTRRNGALVGGVTATILALVLGLLGTIDQMREAFDARDEALDSQKQLEEIVSFQTRTHARLRIQDVGKELHTELEAEYRKGLTGIDESAIEANLEECRAELELVNGANLARGILSKTIAAEAEEQIDAGFTDDPRVEAELRASVASVYATLGLDDKAIVQRQQAFDLLKGEYPADSERVLRAGSLLGSSQMTAGEYADAEANLRSVLEILRARPEEMRALRLKTLNSLGSLLRKTERPDEAVECFQEVIASANPEDELEELQLFAGRERLALILGDSGQYEQAYDQWMEVLKARERTIGPNAVSTITVRNNLMAMLFRMERFEEAKEQARLVIPAYTELKGDVHHLTLTARNNWARIMLDTGQFEESAQELAEVYALAKANLPPTHETRLITTANYIDALTELDRTEEAIPISRELVEEQRALNQQFPVELSKALEQLGICLLRRTPADAEAEIVLRECVEIRESIATDHWMSHWARNLLGASLSAQGKKADAAPLLESSVEGLERQADAIAPFRKDSILEDARENLRTLD